MFLIVSMTTNKNWPQNRFHNIPNLQCCKLWKHSFFQDLQSIFVKINNNRLMKQLILNCCETMFNSGTNRLKCCMLSGILRVIIFGRETVPSRRCWGSILYFGGCIQFFPNNGEVHFYCKIVSFELWILFYGKVSLCRGLICFSIY